MVTVLFEFGVSFREAYVMRKWLLALAALATVATVGGWAYVRAAAGSACCSSGSTIVCPLTGEEIPPCCCQLKK